MSSRVAFRATLITLMLLIVVAVIVCGCVANVQNDNQTVEMRFSCAGIAGLLEKIPEEDLRVEALHAFDSGNWDVALFQRDGTAIFKSKRQAEPLSEEDLAAVSDEEVSSYQRKSASGIQTLYAIYQLTDGAFLRISIKSASMRSVFSEQSHIVFLTILSVCIIVFISVLTFVSRKQRLLDQLMLVLTDFSEGNCDARISSEGIPSAEAAEYNALIARMQERMVRQRSRNHALSVVMNQMQNGIIAVDQDFRVMLVTPVAKKLLGIVGNPEGMLVSDASNDVKLDDVLAEAMRQGGVYTNDVAARTTMGRGRRPLRLYVSPMRQDGNVVGALAMVEDITELRRLEQVRTDFAANVSHELKTPLTSIRGFVETLEAGAIDNPEMAHKFLRIIMLETERLTRLINDILSITKLESGEDEVSIERIRIDKVAYEVADMLRIHASEKGITINAHMNSTPVYIDGNPDRVEQMLINLVENGIKYNKPGEGSVTVQVSSDGTNANISIADTGIGIAEESLPRLFERFYRVDKGRSRSMGGTGLGLAIVKHIVRSMNGEIEVQSKLGEGTEFLVTLPLSKDMSKDEKDEESFGE